MLITLHKFLKKTGLFSVRESERLIREGKIKVNGKVILDPVFMVNPYEDIVVWNKKRLIISGNKQFVYYKFYKPKGVVSSRKDELGRKTVYDYIPEGLPYLFYVGRLDYHSEGLMILTNDGEFAQKVTKPEAEIPKTYLVKIKGKPDREIFLRLEKGVKIDRHLRTKPCKIEIVGETENNTWTKWTIYEGKNRQIRKMCEKVNLKVMKLKRVKIGSIKLGKLKPGEIRRIDEKELARFKKYLS